MGQLLGGLGQGVLLAAEPGHETAPPDQAPILQPAQGPLQLPPGQAQRVADGQVPEHDAPPAQQLLGHRFGQVVAVAVSRAGAGTRAHRPAAAAVGWGIPAQPGQTAAGRPAGAGGRPRPGPGWHRTRRT